jgi:hypothetical protein
MSGPTTFAEYRGRCSDYLGRIATYRYVGQEEIAGLAALKVECQKCCRNVPKQGDSVELLEGFLERVKAARQAFTDAAGKATYEWVDSDPYAYGGGGSRELTPGVRNAAVASLHGLLNYVVYDVDMMKSKSEIDALVRAFCTPVEELWGYVENSGYHPWGWQDTDVKPRVREAHALLESSNSYLKGSGLQPTVDDVRAILQKLGEVAGAKARVRNHRNEPPLQQLLQKCGPPLKAYVDSIDPEKSDSLPWRNGWKTTVGSEMHEMDIQELLCRMKQINCV